MPLRQVSMFEQGPDGPRFRLAGAPDAPPPGAGEVGVAVEGAAIDADRPLVAGTDRAPDAVRGSVIGTVTAVGEGVAELREGDRVAGFGAVAERVVCDAAGLCLVPRELSDADAVLLPWGAMALHIVERLAPLNGPTLVNGLGALGLVTAAALRRAECAPLFGVDHREERRRLGLAVGIGRAEGPRWAEWAADPKSAFAPAPSRGVETTGDPDAILGLLNVMSRMGRMALAGGSKGRTADVDFYSTVHRRGLMVIGIQEPGSLAPGSHAPNGPSGEDVVSRAAALVSVFRAVPGCFPQGAIPATDVGRWRREEAFVWVYWTRPSASVPAGRRAGVSR